MVWCVLQSEKYGALFNECSFLTIIKAECLSSPNDSNKVEKTKTMDKHYVVPEKKTSVQ